MELVFSIRHSLISSKRNFTNTICVVVLLDKLRDKKSANWMNPLSYFVS